MHREDAQEKFHIADALYREEKYVEALELLDELELAYPRQKNIMLPRARCLAKLSRSDEAVSVCNEIIERHQSPKAENLRSLILSRRSDSSITDQGTDTSFDPLEIDFEPAQPPPYPEPLYKTEDVLALRILAVTAVVIFIMTAGYLLLFHYSLF